MVAVNNNATEVENDEMVSIDTDGNMHVNKETHAPDKLLARRAIEAHLEVKELEKSINEFYWEEDI